MFGLAVLAFTAVIREGLETRCSWWARRASAETGAPACCSARSSASASRSCWASASTAGAPGQPPHVLPLDGHRVDLHRGRPAVARGPRVRRDRLDHRRHPAGVRRIHGPAARGSRGAPGGSCSSSASSSGRCSATRRSPRSRRSSCGWSTSSSSSPSTFGRSRSRRPRPSPVPAPARRPEGSTTGIRARVRASGTGRAGPSADLAGLA